MSDNDETSRLLADSEHTKRLYNTAVRESPRKVSSASSTDIESASAARNSHGSPLRRHSSAGLQPEYHQHRSSVKHWQQSAVGDADEEDEQASTASIYAVVPVLLLGVFVANADGSLVIASSQQIASEFGQLSQASWLVTSYILAQASSQPIYGKLCDIFGRKANLITAYVFFTAGLLLCGAGQAYWVLMAGRLISGIGAAGMTAIVSM